MPQSLSMKKKRRSHAGEEKVIKTDQDAKRGVHDALVAYGAFSVSESQVENVRRYIEQQEEHHRTMTLQDELRMFSSRHRLDVDERYVWDVCCAPTGLFGIARR